MKTDTKLQNDVLEELNWNPSVESAQIGVTAHNGVVTLTGAVPSYAQRLTAENVVKRVKGVKAIANDIEVRFCRSSERTDAEIAEAALKALVWDSSVPDHLISLTVSKGAVTLDGTVDWHFQRQAAFNAVKNLAGVAVVNNVIKVRPAPSDSDVKRLIRSAFHRYADLDSAKIEVHTSDHTVTLDGTVRSFAEKEEAEAAAWMAKGVTAVNNNLRVSI